MIDFAIIGNYRNSIWEGLPHIFYQALHSKWIPSLSHSLRPLFPTCRNILALECLVWAPPWRPAYSKRHQVSLNNKAPRRDTLEPTCPRGRFRSAPWRSELFLILDGFRAFVGHNLMIRTAILVSFANFISMHLCIHVKWSITTWWFVKMLV